MNSKLTVMDCTLRDGANVVGKGFDAGLTTMMIEGLIRSGITTIEMGNAVGLGAYEANGANAPLNDREYLELIRPYLPKAEIGMFLGYKNGTQANIALAAEYGLRFLRVGANAGDGSDARDAVKRVKAAGLKCRYSLMKAYILDPDALAEEAKMLADYGLDEITIMDSAGTMMPDEVEEYASALTGSVTIPVAFHGHNNLGFSSANALAAYRGGVTVFDSGLLGMARSAGNCSTEALVAAFQRKGLMTDIDFFALLDFLDSALIPAMEKYGYRAPVSPLDLVFGYAGCHSSFTEMFRDTAERQHVPLYRLITEVSAIDRKAPSQALLDRVARTLK